MSQSYRIFNFMQINQLPINPLPRIAKSIGPFSIEYSTGKPDDFVTIRCPDNHYAASNFLSAMFPGVSSVDELRVDLLVDITFSIAKTAGHHNWIFNACYNDDISVNQQLAYFDWLLALKDLAFTKYTLKYTLEHALEYDIKKLGAEIPKLKAQEKERRNRYTQMKNRLQTDAKQSPSVSASARIMSDAKQLFFSASDGAAAGFTDEDRFEAIYRVMHAFVPSKSLDAIKEHISYCLSPRPPGGPHVKL